MLISTYNIILSGATLMICAYMFARSIVNKAWVFWGVAVIGVVQAVYAIFQCCGFAEGGHIIFDITGFMGNPGQLGGFQAVSLISLLSIYEKGRSRLSMTIWTLVVMLILSSLILADSRASILACVTGIIVLTHRHWYGFVEKHKWMWMIVIGFILIVMLLLYYYRPDSANSRLLIWRVCFDMFADKPLLGFGTGGFNMNYMLYLSEFLTDHPGHVLSSYAADASYPYNELIHILIDYGLIGFLLFAGFVVYIIKGAAGKREVAPFVTFLTFALFSYPSYKLALITLFPLLLGVLHPTQAEQSPKRVILVIMTLGLAGICTANILYGQYKFKKSLSKIHMENCSPDCIDFINRYFNENYPVLKVNAMYATATKSLPKILSEQNISLIFPSSENWCTIGRHYLDCGEYAVAEKYFRQASQMVPNLIEPKYLLWSTYLLQGKEAEAMMLAKDILQMNVKVENTYTLRIKSEIFRYLSKTR